jgi:hypothetical protein
LALIFDVETKPTLSILSVTNFNYLMEGLPRTLAGGIQDAKFEYHQFL